MEFEDYLVLVDYKTDRVSDINELAEKYKRQIELYKLTLEKTEIKPVKEASIYSFSKKSRNTSFIIFKNIWNLSDKCAIIKRSEKIKRRK